MNRQAARGVTGNRRGRAQVLVDTNVLVSFLSERNAVQQQQADQLFAAAESGEAVMILHQVVITELVFVLLNIYGLAAVDVAATVDDLLALPGVSAIDEVAWPMVLDLWPERTSGLADAILVAVAQAGRYQVVATFDLKLRRFLKQQGLRSYW
jgi:predicted nucleic acid-binding protein